MFGMARDCVRKRFAAVTCSRTAWPRSSHAGCWTDPDERNLHLGGAEGLEQRLELAWRSGDGPLLKGRSVAYARCARRVELLRASDRRRLPPDHPLVIGIEFDRPLLVGARAPLVAARAPQAAAAA